MTERQDVVFQAIGRASVCWLGEVPQGIFDSTKAKQTGLDLLTYLDTGQLPEWFVA